MAKRFQIVFIFASVFFITCLIWGYNSPLLLFRVLPEFKNIFRFVEPARDKVLRVIDQVNPKLWLKLSHLDRLETINIKLSARDIEALNKETNKAIKRRFHSTENRNFRRVGLLFRNKTIKAKLAIHGTTMPHWSRPKKSLDVKISKNGDYLDGVRKFALLAPDTRRFALPLMASHIANELDLMFPETRLVRVTLNDRDSGSYFLEEKIDQDFLERRGKSNHIVIKLSDNWAEDHYTDFSGVVDPLGHHITPFDHEISNVDNVNFKNPKVVYDAVDRLFRYVKSGNTKEIRSLVDLDEMARYEVFRTIFGKSHDAAGDNQRLIYSLTDGKFRAVARSESEIRPIKLRGGSFAHSVNFYNGRPILLFVRLNQIPEYRELKYRYLYKFVDNYSKTRKQLQSIILANRDILLYDNSHYFPIPVREKVMIENLDVIDQNVKTIRKTLESSRIYINIRQYPSRLEFEIIPDSESRIKVDTIRIQFKDKQFNSKAKLIPKETLDRVSVQSGIFDLKGGIRDKIIMAQFDDQLELQRTTFNFSVQFSSPSIPEIEKVFLRALNDVTKEAISEGDRYLKISTSTHLDGVYRNSSKENFEAFYSGSFPRMTINGKEIRFTKGNYAVNSNLIIPEGFDVIVEAGVNFLMAPNVSIICFSPVKFLGKENEPVVIQPSQKGKFYGTFAVVGERENLISTQLEWVNAGGGSEAFINGLYFSGGLSLHHARVTMKNSTIHNHSGDDGLNIKYGDVDIRDSTFISNFSDQIDCDFCVGIFKNNKFFGGENSNGDGLDLSGSWVKVIENSFESFHDKGVSAGEKTRVLLVKNLIQDSGIGVAVKDHSKSYLLDNSFKRNKVALSLYRKKPIFGGGHAWLLDNRFESNNAKKKKDLDSSIRILDKSWFNKENEQILKAIISKKIVNSLDYFDKLESFLKD